MQKLIAALTLFLLIEAAPLAAQVEIRDLVISNGRIIDGNPRFAGDVAGRGDRIARTGRLGAHPRGFGTFPRIPGKYVREEGILTLEEAIRKMTSLAASPARLFDRGLLRPGYFADITIFDPNQIRDVATIEDPNRHSAGVRFVVVNGKRVVEAGRPNGALPGRPLRGPGFQANLRPPTPSAG